MQATRKMSLFIQGQVGENNEESIRQNTSGHNPNVAGHFITTPGELQSCPFVLPVFPEIISLHRAAKSVLGSSIAVRIRNCTYAS